MICWWLNTSGEDNKPGTVSRSLRQGMDGNSIISQLTGAKVLRMNQAYSQAVSHGDTVVQCAVNFTFKRPFSHEPVIKPNQTMCNAHSLFPPPEWFSFVCMLFTFAALVEYGLVLAILRPSTKRERECARRGGGNPRPSSVTVAPSSSTADKSTEQVENDDGKEN